MRVELSTELHLTKELAYEDYKVCHELFWRMGFVSTYPAVLHTAERLCGEKMYKLVVQMRK
jgi:hypothetical protein